MLRIDVITIFPELFEVFRTTGVLGGAIERGLIELTAHDLREAINKHPVQRLTPTIEALLPHVRLPFQDPPRRRETG